MKEIRTDPKKKKRNNIPYHGLEELILLICPYYPKPAIDSMQSL